LSLEAAAIFAEVADSRGVLLEPLLTQILHEQTERINQRARRRETRRSLDGAWRFGPDSSRRNPRDT